MLLEIPQPYDFELSAARFRNFGSDRATVWHEGGLHRVVGGREVRITAAPGGVHIEPWSEEAAVEIGMLLGLPFDLDAFRERAVADRVLGEIVEAYYHAVKSYEGKEQILHVVAAVLTEDPGNVHISFRSYEKPEARKGAEADVAKAEDLLWAEGRKVEGEKRQTIQEIIANMKCSL